MHDPEATPSSRGRAPGVALSVVIAAHDAIAVIDTCLEALEAQSLAHDVEVIVADGSRDGTADRIAKRFPWVRLLRETPSSTVPILRGKAIACARGRVIGVLDPFSVAAPDWVERTIDAHRRERCAVIGGSVGLFRAETSGADAWALFLNEYALFMPPVIGGETWIVAGSNVTYKREALFAGATPRYPVFWKTFVNQDVERSGVALRLDPGLHVDLNKPIPFGDFLRSRFHHGRCFAAMRVRHSSMAVRVARTLSTPLVPALLLWRWTRGFWPKHSRRDRFVRAVPAQLALFTMWAAGEACGYLFGPGDSCDRIFY